MSENIKMWIAYLWWCIMAIRVPCRANKDHNEDKDNKNSKDIETRRLEQPLRPDTNNNCNFAMYINFFAGKCQTLNWHCELISRYIMYYSTSESMKYEEMTCIFDRNKFLLFICIVLHTQWVGCEGGLMQRQEPRTTFQPLTNLQPSPRSWHPFISSSSSASIQARLSTWNLHFGALHHWALW